MSASIYAYKKVVSAQGIPSSLPVTQSACQPASLQFASLQYIVLPHYQLSFGPIQGVVAFGLVEC